MNLADLLERHSPLKSRGKLFPLLQGQLNGMSFFVIDWHSAHCECAFNREIYTPLCRRLLTMPTIRKQKGKFIKTSSFMEHLMSHNMQLLISSERLISVFTCWVSWASFHNLFLRQESLIETFFVAFHGPYRNVLLAQCNSSPSDFWLHRLCVVIPQWPNTDANRSKTQEKFCFCFRLKSTSILSSLRLAHSAKSSTAPGGRET